MKNILKDQDIEYLTIVDREFNEIPKIQKNNTIILLVVRFGRYKIIR